MRTLTLTFMLLAAPASAAPILPNFNAVFPATPTGWSISIDPDWMITGGGAESYVTFNEPLTGILRFDYRMAVRDVGAYQLSSNGGAGGFLPNNGGSLLDPFFPHERYFAQFQRPGVLEFIFPDDTPPYPYVTALLYVDGVTRVGFGVNATRSPETMSVRREWDFTPTPIPEPGTLALVGAGLYAAYRRHRRQ